MTKEDSPVVSFDDEPLIVVDENNRVVDYRSKADCHAGEGILHRAFSVFLFDTRGRLLLQKRSGAKRLWPLTWSNSCCSHPRRGETEIEAAHRRIEEELGVRCELEFLFRFRYHASYEDKGSESELCSVFLGRTADPLVPNENEIDELAWVDVDAFDVALRANPDRYTPWLRLEWERMRTEFRARLKPYARP